MAPAPILMDLDGTLVDSLPDLVASTNHVLTTLGHGPLQPAEVRGLVGSGLRALLDGALAHGLGRPPGAGELDEAAAVYRKHHVEQCTRKVQPFPGVMATLSRWRERGHPMAVVTNKPEGFSRRILAATGIDRFAPVLVGGDTTAERKPSALPVRAALAALGELQGAAGWADSPPAGAVMIGDGHHDIGAGRAAGIATVGVTYGYQDRSAVVAANPDVLWETFGGKLPG